MNTKELAKIIKIAVREEVNRSVRKLVQEEVTKAMGTVIAELLLSKGDVLSETANKIVKKEVEEVEEVVEEAVAPVTPTKSPVQIKTGNVALDSLLQETAATHKGIPREDSVDYGDLVGRFDKIGVADTETSFESHQTGAPKRPETKIDYLKNMVGVTPSSAPQSVIADPQAVPDVLKGVFKKDYSKLLKKMDEVKKNGGGTINPGMVTMG